MSIGDALAQAAAAVASRVARWRGLYGAVSVGELPAELKARTVYIVGEGGHQWFAAFLCPCGCSEIIHASLLQRSRPH